jgi:hypothetical protein
MPDDLNAQIAQTLFGWAYQDGLWGEPMGVGLWTMHTRVPAYTTDPAATAQVWQWVEGQRVTSILFEYYAIPPHTVLCWINKGRSREQTGKGATWPEALCRAALALAKGVETEHHAQ